MKKRNKAKLKSARERAFAAKPLGDPPLSPVPLYLSCNANVYRRYPYIGGFTLFVYFQYRKVSVLLRKSILSPTHTQSEKRCIISSAKTEKKPTRKKNCKIFLLALVLLKKGSVCCLISFLAEGEGFALQRLPIGYAEGAIACSPGNAVRCPGFEHLAFFKNSPLTAGKLFWRKARDSNPRILAHQRFSRPPLSTAQPAFRNEKIIAYRAAICK